MKTNHYGVILADPPWAYRVNKETPYNNGVADAQYSTMSDEDILTLSVDGNLVKDLAKDDSVLLLWTTWPKLVEGLQTVEAWGFNYVTGMPWVKTQGLPETNQKFWGTAEETWSFTPAYGVGFWLRGVTEVVLIAKRGQPRIPKGDGVCGLICERMQHSRKPDNLHYYAELMDGPYLELFARRPRDGWEAWGNEGV